MNSQIKSVGPGKRLRYALETGFVRTLAVIVRRLPRRRARQLGRGIGWLAYYLAPGPRRIALANLDLAFGPSRSSAEKKRIARLSSQNAIGTLVALLWAPRLTRAGLDEMVELDGESLARAREIYSRRRGTIVIALHYGDWELLGLATALYGLPLTVVTEEMRNTGLEEIFRRCRSHTGQQIVPHRMAAPKLFKTLKRGGGVGLMIDLNGRRRGGGVWIEFFGRPVFNSAAVATLALRSGASIVPCVAHPLADGRVRIVYHPPIEYVPTGHDDTDVRALSQKCLDFCETLIRGHPEFWLWSYRRWRYAPTADLAGFPFYARPMNDAAAAS